LKILFCNYEYPPLGGGGGVVMAALARELARRHSVTVLTSGGLGLPAESLDGAARILRVPVFFRRKLEVANVPSMLAYPPMAGLRGLALGRGVDVINTHFVVPSGPVGHLLGGLFRVPNVLSVHGGDLYDPSKATSPHRHAWLRLPIRRLLEKADAVVGQSRNTLEHVTGIYGVRRKTELIPLGIDPPPAVAPATRADFGLPEKAFVMITVGRMVPRKATVRLVEALHAVQQPDAHLMIVGDGPDAQAVRRAAAERNLAERVHVLGQVSHIRKYQALGIADVFVSTSQHEGFGLVFLEAMAMGLPVVCYDHGGQTDFLVNGRTGFVVGLNDLGAFVNSLRALHDQPQMVREMADGNRRLVQDYLIDRCAERYERVFEGAIELRARKRVIA
jgi:glycosyltransferase involved in cell wall biosynthesis